MYSGRGARAPDGPPCPHITHVYTPIHATAGKGRVCVRKSERGTGRGAKLFSACLKEAEARGGVNKAKLGAQIQALGFYQKLGFEAFGPVYLDAGIEHRDMIRKLH